MTIGSELCRGFFKQAVRPLLDERLPWLRYGAARLGGGSDMLGLDDGMSRDHDFGPQLVLLVESDEINPVRAVLDEALPDRFAGHDVRFATTWDPTPRHRVGVEETRDYLRRSLGCDPLDELTVTDWLGLTGQAVLEIIAGELYIDTAGELTAVRERLRWYPDDLWRYTVAADWGRLAEELPLMGRAGDRGDELGSRVIAARLVGVAMHLGFMLERRWPPYPKWLGTVFAALPSASRAVTPLAECLRAETWPERQRLLGEALSLLLDTQRDAGLPTHRPAVVPFHERPYLVVPEWLPGTLRSTIASPEVRALPPGAGTAEQRSDNVAVLMRPGVRRRLVSNRQRDNPDRRREAIGKGRLRR